MSNELWMDNLNIVSFEDTIHRRKRRRTYHTTCKTVPDSCPKCGCDSIYKHGTDTQRYMDAPAFGRQVYIRCEVQRWRCRSIECRATFSQDMPDMDGRRQMTRRCVEEVALMGGELTNAAVARFVGIHEKTVREICAESRKARMTERKITAPLLLGIDELTLDGKNRRRTIFVDLGERKPIDIIDTMSRSQVERWLWALPNREKVQIVTMDMWRPYRDAVRGILPQAKIVVDKFHVIVPVGMALDKVRNRARSLSSTPRKNPRQGKILLQTSRHRLTPMRQMLLDGIIKNYPMIGDAWRAKEAFFDIWDADTREEAERLYDLWRVSIPDSIQLEFGTPVVGMIDNWRNEIFAYFDYAITNAYTEAANGIAKILNRNGRGYAFDNIRTKFLLRQSPNVRPCEICKGDFPASSLRPVGISLPQWEGDVLSHKMCGNCHYVFHTQFMPGWGQYLGAVSTAKPE